MKIVVKRNGEIDILRFVFSIMILMYHFRNWFDHAYFKSGYIGVEFFFVVAGFLMAKHVEREQLELKVLKITDTTWKYILSKVRTFFRYYISAIAIQAVIREIIIRDIGPKKFLIELFRSIPIFTLSFMGLSTGSTQFQVENTWFLSAMLLAILILFPILLFSYDFSTKIIFPIMAVLILGYISNEYEAFANPSFWTGFSYKGLLRAIGEMALGASLCPLSSFIINFYTKKTSELKVGIKTTYKIILTAFKYGCFLVVIAYACFYNFRSNFDIHALLLCSVGILLSFSNVGYTFSGNKVTQYLGKISLPVFIYHSMINSILKFTIKERILSPLHYSILIVCVVCTSVVLMYLTDLFLSAINRYRKNIARPQNST